MQEYLQWQLQLAKDQLIYTVLSLQDVAKYQSIVATIEDILTLPDQLDKLKVNDKVVTQRKAERM